VRILYVLDREQRFFPIVHPETYSDLLYILYVDFSFTPEGGVLRFDDSSEHAMHVCSETTYRALLPKHRTIYPDTEVVYTTVSLTVY
jgi:hypothetical protein